MHLAQDRKPTFSPNSLQLWQPKSIATITAQTLIAVTCSPISPNPSLLWPVFVPKVVFPKTAKWAVAGEGCSTHFWAFLVEPAKDHCISDFSEIAHQFQSFKPLTTHSIKPGNQEAKGWLVTAAGNLWEVAVQIQLYPRFNPKLPLNFQRMKKLFQNRWSLGFLFPLQLHYKKEALCRPKPTQTT